MTELKNLIPDIREFAIQHMPQDILHGWPHVQRLLKYAKMINEEVNGDWVVIQCAILLHDIGHRINREKHNEIGAKMAEEYLESKNIDQATIQNIKNAILAHSRQFAKIKPKSLEAKVLYDSDGMDLFGPIGLMRALLSCALRNEGFDGMIKKLEWRISETSNFYSNFAKEFVKNNVPIIEKWDLSN
jgi:putative nucleotidyltransferase with HDIG domain